MSFLKIRAHRWHIVPAFNRQPLRREATELTPEADDSRRLRKFRPCELPRSAPADVDTVPEKSLDNSRRDLGVRLKPGCSDFEVQASLAGKAPKILRGDDALGRAVQAHEEDRSRRRHGGFLLALSMTV